MSKSQRPKTDRPVFFLVYNDVDKFIYQARYDSGPLMVIQFSPSEFEKYRAAARKRDIEVRKQLNERKQRAWKISKEAALILKKEFGASRVVLFGSLLHPERFHLRSDIDLAVWDIQKYFRAVARLIDLDPEIEFDLVPIEDARPGILAVIQEEGVDL